MAPHGKQRVAATARSNPVASRSLAAKSENVVVPRLMFFGIGLAFSACDQVP
jgi:hypothetical protein